MAGSARWQAVQGTAGSDERENDMAYDVVAERIDTASSAVTEVLGEVLDASLVRGGAALDALRGSRVGPPVAIRRWPWALAAAVVGAAAGAGVAYVVGRVVGRDAPDAQEPEDVQAVVDRAPETASPETASPA